jgi:hypothetical protein
LAARSRQFRELGPFGDAPEHQPAPAHVTSTYKLGREQEPLAEDGQQHVDVFRAREGAQQKWLAAPAERVREHLLSG